MGTEGQPEAVQPRIGLWDAVSIIIGIIIGVGIFRAPVDVLKNVSGFWPAMGVWALGGLLALVGAFCFAELATTYPRSGGEYVYLSRAYGKGVSFLYAWAQVMVIRPSSIAAVAYIFAEYAQQICRLDPGLLAAASILLLTLVNVMGVTLGKQTQNLLTLAKVMGLGAIAWVGLFWARPHPQGAVMETEAGSLATAMIFVFWAYSGWHEAAYVASEVKNSRRNLPLALILGTIAVTFIYLLVNLAILVGLGFQEARSSKAVAVDLLNSILGSQAGTAANLVVLISALGAINGMIFTTARLYLVMGMDHPVFAPLSSWNRKLDTPVRALLAEAALSLAFVAGVHALWKENGFDSLVKCTAAVFWLFFLLTGLALFVLRRKDAHLPRPFQVPVYPLMPILFCGLCGFMFFGAILAAPRKSLIGLAILLAGLPFFFWPKSWGKSQSPEVDLPTSSAGPVTRPGPEEPVSQFRC